MSYDSIKNNMAKMFNTNRDNVDNEVARLGSVEHRDTSYRRNGMSNFGARQMLNLSGITEVYVIGVGGSPVVGP